MRKWLSLILLFIPMIVLGQASYDVINVNYKADNLNFNTGNGSKFFNLVLTGNVNTSGLNGGSLGMEVIFNICQDNVGGHTFNWPPNVINPPPINSAALACTATRFVNIGNFQWTNTGNANGTGAGTPAAGSPPQTQVNDPGNPGHFGGTPCENFPSLSVGPINADCDWHSKGPNPLIDITRYGARSCNQSVAPCAAGITASINSGSNQATLSSASTFVNGDGVVIFGAGAATTMTAPTGLAVTNVLAQAGTGTGQTVAGATTGSTTRCYKIIARGTGGGFSAASSEVCNTTGQTSLGTVIVNISSCTRAQTLVTCTTSSATPLNVNNVNSNVGGEVYIGGSPSDSSFRGWRQVAAVSDSTHFTFVDSIVNTVNGASTSETGGTAQFFVANHLTWTAVTNAWLYYIYEGSSGAETLIGVSRPQGISAGVTDTTFDDFGPTMMANYVFPAWIPTTPPVSAANDNLSTTITSGAGTTTVTLAANAGATVSGAGIRLDAGPALVAAAAVASLSGPLFIPVSANPFVINNYCDLSPYTLSVIQSGQLFLHETLSMRGAGLRWMGDRGTGVGPQSGAAGGWGAYPQIVVAEAVPGMYVNSAGFSVDGISFQTGVTNGALQMLADWAGAFNASLIDTGFAPGTTTADLMGFGLIFRGASGFVWDKGGWGTGNSDHTDSHNAGFYCSGCGDITLRKMYTTGRGMIFKGSPAGTGALRIEEVHYNGGGTPIVSTLGTAQVSLGQPGAQLQMDTIGHPCLAAFGGTLTVYDNNCAPSGYTFISPSVTGVVQFAAGGISVPAVPGSGLTVSPGISLTTQLLPTLSSFDAVQSMIYNVTGPGGISVGLGDSIFANGLIPAPPTCSVSAGGSLALGTYVFGVQPVYWNGLEGTPSAASAGCTTTTGNQTITVNWTTLPSGNPVGYNIYTGGPAGGGTCAACTNPFPPTVTQMVWSSGIAGAPAQNLVPLGGPSSFLPNAKGVAAPEYTLANSTGNATGITSENSAYDNFNRANGAIGSNWTVKVGGVNVSSNVAVGTTSANAVAWNQANFSSFAQFAKITLVTLNGTTDLNGPMVFSQPGANSDYECVENTTTITIQQVLNGSATTVATSASGGSAGDVLLLVATVNPSGTQPTTTLTCYRNGTQILTGTSTTFTSGGAGFRLNGSVATVDNWSGGNLHTVAQLDTEQEWPSAQHFTGPVTIGPISTGAAPLTATGISSDGSNLILGNGTGILATNGTSGITSPPPPVAQPNLGWKACWYGAVFCQGVAAFTEVHLNTGGGWISLFTASPANNATASAPDGNAKVSLGTDGSVRASRYIISGGAAPTCTVTGAGTGATCTLSSFSTDNSGAMQINSGTAPGSSGTWTLTFSAGFPNAAFCTVGPGSGGTVLNPRATVFDNTNGTLGVHSGVWDNNAVAINASQAITFIISYICGGH